jgi:hypothetical protein
MKRALAVAVLLGLVAPAVAGEAKAKQHIRELRQLDPLRDHCITAIINAQRNGNVWPDNETVSLQDCKDMVLKQYGIGMKLLEDSED